MIKKISNGCIVAGLCVQWITCFFVILGLKGGSGSSIGYAVVGIALTYLLSRFITKGIINKNYIVVAISCLCLGFLLTRGASMVVSFGLLDGIIYVLYLMAHVLLYVPLSYVLIQKGFGYGKYL